LLNVDSQKKTVEKLSLCWKGGHMTFRRSFVNCHGSIDHSDFLKWPK